MTEFIFYCSHCGTKLSADDSEVGELFDCPACGTSQRVPDSSSVATRSEQEPVTAARQPESSPAAPRAETTSTPPSKKLVIKASELQEVTAQQEAVEELEAEVEETVQGSGLRVLGMAVGTASIILFLLAIVWMIYAATSENREWWLLMLSFLSVFVLSLMGVVVAVLAFRIERIAALVEITHLGVEE